MKTLGSSFQAHLDSGTTTLCWCWRLEREDGTVQGFTDHDVSVSFDSVSYEAVSGFTASEVQSMLGLSVDNLSVTGALSSASINEDDLAAGVYDNAGIEIWRVNWADPSQRALMRKGNLGEVKRGSTAFETEVRGMAHLLNQPVGRAFGSLCDADLGDARCTVDLDDAAYKGTGTVGAVTDARRFTATGLSDFDGDWFKGGKLTWTSGANNDRSMEVKRHAAGTSAATIELWQSMSEAIVAGDTFAIRAGCDKQFTTCKAKFSNAANFRGFPYMPGNDAVMSYPGQTDDLDGGSRYGN